MILGASDSYLNPVFNACAQRISVLVAITSHLELEVGLDRRQLVVNFARRPVCERGAALKCVFRKLCIHHGTR